MGVPKGKKCTVCVCFLTRFTLRPRSIGASSPLSTTRQGILTLFKSDMIHVLRSPLVRQKDTVDSDKQDGVVYRIHWETYTGEDQKPRQGYTTRPYLDLRRF